MTCRVLVGPPIDDMLLLYADVISELAMVIYVVLMFKYSHFSISNAHCFIEFLSTV